MTDAPQPPTELAAAAARLQGFEGEAADPQLVYLAHMVGERLLSWADVPGPVRPDGMVRVAAYALYDLQHNVDSRTQQPIPDNPFTEASPEEFKALWRHVPRLGEIGVSAKFGEELREELVRMGILPSPEEPEEAPRFTEKDLRTPEPGELITEPITTMEAVETQIISDAEARLLALDWAAFGVPLDQVRDWFRQYYPLLLRHGVMRPPVNVFDIRQQDTRRYIESLPAERKKQLNPNSWLALTLPEIPPGYATATRDFLFLRMVDFIAEEAGRDVMRVTTHFFADPERGPLYTRTVLRHFKFVSARPELFEEEV